MIKLFFPLAPGGERIGDCHVPSGQVNPLNLQGSIGMEDIDPLFPQKPSVPFELNQTHHLRRKRYTEKVVMTTIIMDKDGHRHQVVTMVCTIIIKLLQ